MQSLLWRRWQQNLFSFFLVSIIVLLVPGCVSDISSTQSSAQASNAMNFISPSVFTVSATINSTTISAPQSGIRVSVNLDGSYSITTSTPAWTIGGTVGYPLKHFQVDVSHDALGYYREITFTYQGEVARTDSIRLYGSRPIVLFSTTYNSAAANAEPFPLFTTYPQNLYHLSYHGSFAIARFDLQATDSPWLLFDKQANSMVLSPAANFMVASLKQGKDGSISSGINSAITLLPQGFTHRTMLALGNGINATFNQWGHALTDLEGKVRVANDANVTLNKLGYWTDKGATYYYNFVPTKGYKGTLEAINQEYARQGIPLGYMQLDSWWYDKGNPPDWRNGMGGIYTYTPSPQLFPQGLSAFQQSLGLPLIVHARWIDAQSPYRAQYSMSGNVSTDPRYWASVMSYLRNNGAIAYEQDWLSAQAHSLFNLNDPNAWLSAMADAANQYGLTLQYCMPDPHHLLQSAMYSSVVTTRASNDHFIRARWDEFIYDSRLATALGLWPWTDVFMSNDKMNLLVSTLSAGMVGVGDPLGMENKANLMQSIRTDGVIVKPDTSLLPVDATYINDAQGKKTAMVAAAYSAHGDMNAAYVFAYSHKNTAQELATITPGALGISGDAYVYDYFSGNGTLIKAGQSYSREVDYNGSYFVVAPVGRSGIAFLGDEGKFASLGSKRISDLSDDGTVHATVAFANGEGPVTLHGYAPSQPKITATNGSVGPVIYDSETHLFSIWVSSGTQSSATVNLSL